MKLPHLATGIPLSPLSVKTLSCYFETTENYQEISGCFQAGWYQAELNLVLWEYEVFLSKILSIFLSKKNFILFYQRRIIYWVRIFIVRFFFILIIWEQFMVRRYIFFHVETFQIKFSGFCIWLLNFSHWRTHSE